MPFLNTFTSNSTPRNLPATPPLSNAPFPDMAETPFRKLTSNSIFPDSTSNLTNKLIWKMTSKPPVKRLFFVDQQRPRFPSLTSNRLFPQ